MKMTKKNIFFAGFLALGVALLLEIVNLKYGRFCEYSPQSGYGTNYCEIFAFSLAPLVLLIPLSALFYFLRDKTFEHWVKFAKWGIPVLMFFSALFGGSHPSASIGFDFLPFLVVVLYISFVLVSFGGILRMSADSTEVHIRQSIRSCMKFFGGAMVVVPILSLVAILIWCLVALVS